MTCYSHYGLLKNDYGLNYSSQNANFPVFEKRSLELINHPLFMKNKSEVVKPILNSIQKQKRKEKKPNFSISFQCLEKQTNLS